VGASRHYRRHSLSKRRLQHLVCGLRLCFNRIKQRLTPASLTRARRSRFGTVAVLALVSVILATAIPVVQMRQLVNRQWSDLNTRGVLRIGIDPGFQPFSFYGDHGWDGIDADIGHEIAQRLHLQVQSIPVGYDSLYDALHLWQVDIVLAEVIVDPARTTDYTYTDAYFDAGMKMVTRQPMVISSVDGLAGKRVAAVLGTDADRAVRYWERRLPNVTRVAVTSITDAAALLNEGKVDVVVMDSLEAMGMGAQNGDLSAAPLNNQSYAIALRRDNPILLYRLNQTLAEMQRDGTLYSILTRWSSR
jgi:ABC-type amino acid transport substrate-binding protein